MGTFYIQTNEKLRELAERLAPLGDGYLAVDTETTGLDPLAEGARLLLLQVGIPGDTWVINACRCDLSILKPVLEDGRMCLLQNAKFDYKWLKVHAGIRLMRCYDTMLAELLIIAGLHADTKRRRKEVSLKALCAKYCGVELDKQVRTSFVGHEGDTFSQEQIDYAAEDVPHLFTIRDQQVPQLRDAGLTQIAAVEFRVIPTVGDMELNGIGLDVEQYRPIIEQAKEDRKAAERAVRARFLENGHQKTLFDEDADLCLDLNLNAPDKLKAALKRIGLEVPNTGSETLQALKHPVAEAILTYRGYDKIVTTYGEPVLAAVHPVTGRIHAEYEQLGSDAGRFSCWDPNIQQIPHEKQFRSCFIPAAGHLYVIGDYSQFELRILAEFSQDASMIEAFCAGFDMHTDTAARMFGVPHDQVTKAMRNAAKALNFGLAYGMGPTSLAVKLDSTSEEAKEKMERWFGARPQAAAWLKAAAMRALEEGESRTLAGRRRLFSPPVGDDPRAIRGQIGAIERAGKNTPIQGSNADMLKIAMRAVADRLEVAGIVGPHVGLVACVHDEIVLEVPEDRAEEAVGILREEMVRAGERYLKSVPVEAEVGVGSSWVK